MRTRRWRASGAWATRGRRRWGWRGGGAPVLVGGEVAGGGAGAGGGPAARHQWGSFLAGRYWPQIGAVIPFVFSVGRGCERGKGGVALRGETERRSGGG